MVNSSLDLLIQNYIMLKQYIIFILASVAHNIITSTVNNYGEFSLTVTNLKTCKGPKQKECCNVNARMYNASTMLYDIQILKNVSPDKGKITATANGKPLVRLQMKNPCDHLFIGSLFRGILKASSDCVFKKGNYTFNLNIEDVARKYYKGMFLYGNLSFRSLFYNDECNFSCTIVEVEIYPKNNTSV